MSHDPLSNVIARLEAGGFEPRPTGSGSWESRCPAHQGSRRNLSIALGDDGRVLLHCHHTSECSHKDIIEALGMNEADLFVESDRPRSKTRAPSRTYPTFKDFVTALAPKLGRPTAYGYQDANGQTVMGVARFDADDGSKTYRPAHKTPDGWQSGDPTGKLPLYRMPDIVASDERIYVCEGEKAVDLVRSLGLTATTSAHGSNSASKTDWSALAGKEVIVCPDNDEPGFKYLNDVKMILSGLVPTPVVRVLYLTGIWRTDAPIQEGDDIAEWLSAGVPSGWAPEQCGVELERLADEVPAEVLPVATAHGAPKLELDDVGDDEPVGLPPVEPFPLHVLPPAVAEMVKEVAESIGCPVDFPAVAALAIASGVIGRSVALLLKPGYFANTVIWAAQIGPPSDGKSPANTAMLEPVRRIDEMLATEHAQNIARWEDESAQNPKVKIPRPRPRRIDVDDATSEALDLIEADNPRGLIQVQDEVASFVLSMNQYRGGKGTDRQRSLKKWSGVSGKKDRVGRDGGEPIRNPHPNMTVFGGIQPDMIGELVDSRGRRDGFLDRFVLTYPDQLPVPDWSERGISDKAVEDWCAVVLRLWERPLSDKNGQLAPHAARFTPEGKARWIEGYNAHAAEMRSPDFPPHLRGPWGKFREYAGRFASVSACLWHASDPTADPLVIPDAAVQNADGAWELVRYFKSHARRAYAALDAKHREAVADKLDADVKKTYSALKAAPGGLARTAIRNAVFKGHRSSEEMDQIRTTLARSDLGYFRTESTGGADAETWFSGKDPCASSAVRGVIGNNPDPGALNAHSAQGVSPDSTPNGREVYEL
ncbi:MAG: DUF3987 domain-containing protein [Isosphaeraceae bacterium]